MTMLEAIKIFSLVGSYQTEIIIENVNVSCIQIEGIPAFIDCMDLVIMT